MAQGSNYKVAFRRRREGKTDYGQRFKLADLDTPRLVVRVSNANVIVQIINIRNGGDETVVSAHSKELRKLGWLGGSKNTSAVYLTGYLCAKKALSEGVEYAVLDIKKKLYDYEEYRGYMDNYNQVMYLVMDINSRYQGLVGQKGCHK